MTEQVARQQMIHELVETSVILVNGMTPASGKVN
jgi:hypothetical protein